MQLSRLAPLICVAALGLTHAISPAGAQEAGQISPETILRPSVIEVRFTPTRFAQLAVWIEDEDGTRFETVRLTEAVALRGIGNRPGASQMNSGYRWPYGRREGVLPVWATRRAAAPGAMKWKRVIFQNRPSEGLASKIFDDQSKDDYYCLSFARERSRQDALDAVSCATQFSSDKGRFVNEADVAAGYSEPYEATPGAGQMRPLSLESLYPPRRDINLCSSAPCFDHLDVDQFSSHARSVMPEIDAVTMATPVAGVQQEILFEVPSEWEHGSYRACVEANVEGDYNETWNDRSFPTPTQPPSTWDGWAIDFGYAYRGQPSVVYCVDFELGHDAVMSFAASEPAGSSASWQVEDPSFGELQPMDHMTDDPVRAPGSGVDRLQLMADGDRLQIVVKPPRSCMHDQPPSAVGSLVAQSYPNEKHAHEFARLSFRAADDDEGIHRYDVRFSTSPIDDESFTAAMPAKQATVEAQELQVPTDATAGEPVRVDVGGFVQETRYFIGVRAMDECTGVGPVAVTEITMPKRVFSTVTPCFVATAAYGSPLASEIHTLRRLRDRYLMPHAFGRELVAAYYRVGPSLADGIASDERLRSAARWAITPLVSLARWLER